MRLKKCKRSDSSNCGDLYVALNPPKEKLQGPPYFVSRMEYQRRAIVSLIEIFNSEIEVEIDIGPDTLPNMSAFLGLVRRPLQQSGIRLTLADCLHLGRIVDYIIVRGILKPIHRPGFTWYPNPLAKKDFRRRTILLANKSA